MLQKTQAVRALQEGCSRPGLPNSTATALLQFLSVKRTHDQFVPDKYRSLSMLPGSTLDKLWQYMLLNTTVSSCVHALLGGVVDHRDTDTGDLADDTKLLQRLYALNVLRLEGHEPDVELWTEPGTAMHTLRLTAPCVDLQSLPGGGRLYVTPSLTHQQLGQLVRLLLALYMADPQPQRPMARVIQPRPAGAAPAESAASVGCNMEPAAKRPLARVEQRQLQQLGQDAPSLILTIRHFHGGRAPVRYSIKPNMPFSTIFRDYLQQQKMAVGDVFVRPGGTFVGEHNTPKDMGFRDGDVIECVPYDSIRCEWMYPADLIGY